MSIEGLPRLKIFSYLPNPRVWKAVIAGKICGVEVEVIGDKASELGLWLWDFRPKRLEKDELKAAHRFRRKARRGFSGDLYKTDSFLERHPFGTLPAAFSSDGTVGIFESNSILRAVARIGNESSLYGKNHYEASRIDSFLDANLVFAREAQVYLLNCESLSKEGYDRMARAYEFYASGIEATLKKNRYIVGKNLSIADISFACDFSQFLREGHYSERLKDQGFDLITENFSDDYPKTHSHLMLLTEREEFSSVFGSYLDWYRLQIKTLAKNRG
ncbi:glutathione S-transferase family protein [Gammaproteobacteria bacterium]|nr:glutathione S-transferase family protein [Gammaproteobacteria bacterium]